MLLRPDRTHTALDIVLDVAFHAGRGGEPAGAGDIAERLGSARRGIEPVLQALTRAELLEGVRGPRGGYRLARAPRELRLLDVAEAVREEAEPGPAPSRLSAAVTAPLWRELDAALRERLGALTVDDLLRRAAAAGLRRPAAEPISFVI